MATYADANGNARTLNITFRTIFKVAADTGYDLLNPVEVVNGEEKNLEQELLFNQGALAKILFSLCSEDGETQDDFFDSLDGATFKKAEELFWDEYANFFAQSGRVWLAEALRAEIEQKAERERAAVQIIRELPKKTSSELQAQAEAHFGSTPPTGKSQGSPKRRQKK